MCLPTLLTSSDGLAFHRWTSTSSHHHHGYRSASSTRCARCFTSWPSAEHAEPVPNWRSGGCTQDIVRLERVAKGGSNANQQSMEEQDGQRHQKTTSYLMSRHPAQPNCIDTWKCGGVHYVGAADRPGDRRHRLLAVRQLLVPRTGRPGGDGSLTNAKTSPQPTGPHQRRQRVVVVALEAVQPGQRLALGRGVRHGLAEPLTSRNV